MRTMNEKKDDKKKRKQKKMFQVLGIPIDDRINSRDITNWYRSYFKAVQDLDFMKPSLEPLQKLRNWELALENEKKKIIADADEMITQINERGLEWMKQNMNTEYPVEIRNSNDLGEGVFATARIKKGTELDEYAGELLTKEEYEERFPKICEINWRKAPETVAFLNKKTKSTRRILYPNPLRTGLYIHQNEEGMYVDAEDFRYSNWTRYINSIPQGKTQNVAYINDRIVAIRDIKKGEELFDDYGSEYWEGVWFQKK